MSPRTLPAPALLCILSLSVFTPVASAAASFSDVPSTHPHAEAIAYVKTEGIVSGYSDGTFRPDVQINRAEFVKIFMGAEGYDPEKDPSGYDIYFPARAIFTDIDPKAWYVPYVKTAYQRNIIQGYPDGTFRPGSAINFAEAAKIIAQAQRYSVTADGSVWYRGSVEALGERKAIPVSIDSFEKKITRGEMAEMIWRLKADIKTKPSATYESLSSSPPASSAAPRPVSPVGKPYPPLCDGKTYNERFYPAVCFPGEPYLRHTGPTSSATGHCGSPTGCANMESRPWSITHHYSCVAESSQHGLSVYQYSHSGSETYEAKQQEDMRKMLDPKRQEFMFASNYRNGSLSYVSQEHVQIGSHEGILRTFNYESARVGLFQLFELTVDTGRSILFIQTDSFCIPPGQIKTTLISVVESFIKQ